MSEEKEERIYDVVDDVHIAMDAEMFKDFFDLMATLIIIEVQVKIRDDGLYLQQMDEPHVGMTIMFIPKPYFKVLKAGKVVDELRLPVKDIMAILSRLSHGDVIDFSVRESGKLHVEIQGKRIRSFNLPLITPEELERRVPKITPSVKIKTTMEGLLYGIEDAQSFIMSGKKKKEALGQILMKTTAMGLKIEASTEDGLYSSVATLTSGWDIMQFVGSIDQRVAIAVSYGIDMIRAISKITNLVQLEFSTDMPLHIIAELPFKGANLEFWIAPRIEEAAKPTAAEARAAEAKEEVSEE